MNPFLRVGPTTRAASSTTKLVSNLFRTAVPQRPYSHEAYGGGDEPRGPTKTGQDPSPTRNLEHPGPPPPDVSKSPSSSSNAGPSSTSTPTQSRQKTSESQPGSAPSPESASSQKPSREPGTSASSSAAAIPSNKAHPTLNDGKQSPNVDERGEEKPDVPEDVKRHNREVDQRYDKSYNRIGEGGKVEKGFWKEERQQ
ncbi:conserved serine-rich protein [Paecilomyces variotii No. 5]|uniref:Conserved serine-rich protein n=1 Tax=Byssochlamys spectabilis (strain No. 5 / NBRC 109023) TaxID=1356009 RepID=V5GDY8_BYSSN|nr:conserved serine-rich protein [Paecilomyces variotii No. 5]